MFCFQLLGTFLRNRDSLYQAPTVRISIKIPTKNIFLFFSASVDANNVPFTKTYWYPTHFRASWEDAKLLCNSYKMQYLSLDSQHEVDNFFVLFEQRAALFDANTHIGALTTIGKSLTEWYWVESGLKVNFVITWIASNPNNADNNQMCMGLEKSSPGVNKFNDVTCWNGIKSKFICQTFS